MGKKFFFASVFFLFSVVLSLCLGAANLSPQQLWLAFCRGPSDFSGYIVWYSRVPRTCAGVLAGGAMAVSGVVIQSVLNNRLASPSILGVNAGAGLAVTVCCALGALSGSAIAGSAFFGAMAAVGLIVFASEKAGASRTTVILGGVAVNAFLNALSEALTTLVPEIGMMTADFRVGGFGAVSWPRLLPAAVLIGIGLVGLITLAGDLDVLALGSETAQALGMNVRRTRTLLLVLAALLAGSAVSFAGLLGFVGLIVPHVMRYFVGNESRFLIPICALGGGGFVTLCDTLARVVFAPYELPVGILLSVIGGPFFLTLLLNRKGGRRDA